MRSKTCNGVGFVFWCDGCSTAHNLNKDYKVTTDKYGVTVNHGVEVRIGNHKCRLRIEYNLVKYYFDSTHELKGKSVKLKII